MPDYVPIQDLTIVGSIGNNDLFPLSDGSGAYAVRGSTIKSYAASDAAAAAADAALSKTAAQNAAEAAGDAQTAAEAAQAAAEEAIEDASAYADAVSSYANGLNATMVEKAFTAYWTKGKYIDKDTGVQHSLVSYARSNATFNGLPTRNAIQMKNTDYKISLRYYSLDDGTAVPTDGTGFTGSSGGYTNDPIYIPKETNSFAINVRKVDGTTLTDNDVTAINAGLMSFAATDRNLESSDYPADAKITGDRFSRLEYGLYGGEIEFDFAACEKQTGLYEGKEIAVSIGTSLENTKKYSDRRFVNRLFDIPKNTTEVECVQYATSTSWGSVFLDDNDIIVGGIIRRSNESNPVKVRVPIGATKFLYSYIQAYETANISFYNQQEDKGQYPLWLHSEPDSDGVVNGIKNARQLTDIKWTPAMTIPRTSSIMGTGENRYVEDVFTEGVEYTGIPYSDPLTDYNRRLIGISTPLDVFATTVDNARTAQGEDSVYSERAAAYFGTSCTGLTAYALNLPYVYSGYYENIEGMTTLFPVIDNGTPHSLDTIRLLDVIQKSGHCAIVTDIFRSPDGAVEMIEVSEQTRGGRVSRNIVGGQTGGICRRIVVTLDEFYDMFGAYTIMRYAYLDNVKYAPNKYSPVDEGKRLAIIGYPVLPYYGEKCCLDAGDTCKLILSDTDYYTHVVVKKNGVEWNEDGTTNPYPVTGLTELEVECDADAALYTAELAVVSNGSVVTTTTPCSWYVRDTPVVMASIDNNVVTFTVKTKSDKFVPWFVNIKRNTTIYGYNHMIFEGYDYTYTDGYHQYTFTRTQTSATTDYIIGLKSDEYGAWYITGQVV